MCGIIGYIGSRTAGPILIDGLKRLEYRGYDSAGIAVFEDGETKVVRCEGKLFGLEEKLLSHKLTGTAGIGHTRWATHGRPSEENAHPHQYHDVVVVHNGIIENYQVLKEELMAQGNKFSSETDTEIVAHLVYSEVEKDGDFVAAVLRAVARIRGSFALGILWKKEPDKLIAVRMESPLTIGLGKGEFCIASDIPAILPHTRDVVYLKDGQIALLTREECLIYNFDHEPQPLDVRHIDWSPVMAEKEGYKHFMLKEIHEQPLAVTNTLRGRYDAAAGEILLDEIGIDAEWLKKVEKIVILACGTSYHAGMVAKFIFEELCRVPVEVDLASEYRYRDPIVNDRMLCISISQSGETADTLAALKEARGKGATVLAISNVVESSIVRESHGVLYTHAGPEIGVASTKAFTTQISALYLLALYLGQLKERLDRDKVREHLKDLIRLPHLLSEMLKKESRIKDLASEYYVYNDFLYLGRGVQFPIALEGALKLKEISYIHAEGYAAGEMKHGPIALIDEDMPVVILLPLGHTLEKIVGNVEEVKARNGMVIGFVQEGVTGVQSHLDEEFVIPGADKFCSAILFTVPLQLLAYHIAVLRGTDVDQPRNLAKSVTVE